MSRIDEYLAEVRRRASGNAEVSDLITELESHLKMDFEERLAGGMDEGEAELAACKALGPPKQIAEQIFRQSHGFRTKAAWKLAWPCGVVLLLAFVIPYNLLFFPHWIGNPVRVVLWAPFLALMLYGVQVARTRRWLVKPMAAWSTLAAIGVVGGSLVITPPRPASAQTEAGQARIALEIKQAKSEERLVDEWRAGNPPTDQAPYPDGNLAFNNLVVPFVPVMVPIGSSWQPALDPAPSPSEAKARWAKYGQAYADNVHQNMTNLQSELRDTAQSPVIDSTARWRAALLCLAFTAYVVAVLAATNGILLAVLKARENRRSRRYLRAT